MLFATAANGFAFQLVHQLYSNSPESPITCNTQLISEWQDWRLRSIASPRNHGRLRGNPLSALLIYGYIGWLLLLHTVLPKAPSGSWAARDRNDPREIGTRRSSPSPLRGYCGY